MLKDRDEVLQRITSIIYNSHTPYEQCGWPPNMLEHLRTTIHLVSSTIVESIYTEKELQEKAENILLDRPEQI